MADITFYGISLFSSFLPTTCCLLSQCVLFPVPAWEPLFFLHPCPPSTVDMFMSDYSCCWACSKERRWNWVLLPQGWGWRGTNPVMESNRENKPRRVRIVSPVASTDGSQTAATGSTFLTSGLPSSFLSGRTAAQALVVRIRWGVAGTAVCFPFCYTELLSLTKTHTPLLPAHASLGYCLFVFLQEKDSSAWGFSLHRYVGPWPLWEGSREVHCGGGQSLWQWGSAWGSE